MKRYVAFLRGINVTGYNIIKMDVLKEIFLMPGIKNVVTYIQSGNVIFDTKETDNNTLRQKIEKKLHKELGFAVTTIVRSIAEIEQVITDNPLGDPGGDRKLYISFLEQAPDAAKASATEAMCAGDEIMRIAGASVYFLTPSYGNTKFSNTFLEKKLGMAATTRNWATVNKVVTL